MIDPDKYARTEMHTNETVEEMIAGLAKETRGIVRAIRSRKEVKVYSKNTQNKNEGTPL
jgi:hypothetical protein